MTRHYVPNYVAHTKYSPILHTFLQQFALSPILTESERAAIDNYCDQFTKYLNSPYYRSVASRHTLNKCLANLVTVKVLHADAMMTYPYGMFIPHELDSNRGN